MGWCCGCYSQLINDNWNFYFNVIKMLSTTTRPTLQSVSKKYDTAAEVRLIISKN